MKIYEIAVSGDAKPVQIKADSHEEVDGGIELFLAGDKVASYRRIKGWHIVSDANVDINVHFVDSPANESEV